MSTQVKLNQFSESGSQNFNNLSQKGEMNGRTFVPVSQAKYDSCFNCCWAFFFLLTVLGIILWPVGVAQGNAQMVLAGQCLFGIGLSLEVIGLCVFKCLFNASKSSIAD